MLTLGKRRQRALLIELLGADSFSEGSLYHSVLGNETDDTDEGHSVFYSNRKLHWDPIEIVSLIEKVIAFINGDLDVTFQYFGLSLGVKSGAQSIGNCLPSLTYLP